MGVEKIGTPTPSPTPSPTSSPTVSPAETTGQPGFGIAVAILALLAVRHHD